jgi:hypothetical protein
MTGENPVEPPQATRRKPKQRPVNSLRMSIEKFIEVQSTDKLTYSMLSQMLLIFMLQ